MSTSGYVLRSRLKDYVALVRPAALITAVGDPIAGFFLPLQFIFEFPSPDAFVAGILPPILSSLCLYAGGLVLNDVADAPRDKTLHPDRPIPSGRISRTGAALFGVALIASGILIATMSGRKTAGVAGLLAISILLYAFGKNESPNLGTGLMGLCRALNMFLGGMAAVSMPHPHMMFTYVGFSPFFFDVFMLLPFALSLFWYTMGVTTISLLEEKFRMAGLVLGAVEILMGLIFSPMTYKIYYPSQPAFAAIGCFAILAMIHGRHAWILARSRCSSLVHPWTSAGVSGILLIDAAFVFRVGFFNPGILLLALWLVSVIIARLMKHGGE
ncbi:MAG: UbiA family prenyltransferase [Planctomycetota bacterium]